MKLDVVRPFCHRVDRGVIHVNGKKPVKMISLNYENKHE